MFLRFFGERLNGVKSVSERGAALDVSVGGICLGCLYSESEESAVGCHIFEALYDAFREFLLVGDELVGGYDEYVGVPAPLYDMPRGAYGGRSGRKPYGLEEELFGLHFRQLLHGNGGIFLAGADVDMVGGYDGEHAFHGKLQQRLADSEEVDELLRMVLPAYRPQAFAYTAGQDDTIIIVVFHGSEWLSSKGKYTMF